MWSVQSEKIMKQNKKKERVNYTKTISIETTTLDREINKIQQRIKLIKLEA